MVYMHSAHPHNVTSNSARKIHTLSITSINQNMPTYCKHMLSIIYDVHTFLSAGAVTHSVC